MTGPIEQKLEQIATRMGWRLRWSEAPLTCYPAQVCTELDVFQGNHLVTRNGPAASIWTRADGASERARERVARMILMALPKPRGAS